MGLLHSSVPLSLLVLAYFLTTMPNFQARAEFDPEDGLFQMAEALLDGNRTTIKCPGCQRVGTYIRSSSGSRRRYQCSECKLSKGVKSFLAFWRGVSPTESSSDPSLDSFPDSSQEYNHSFPGESGKGALKSLSKRASNDDGKDVGLFGTGQSTADPVVIGDRLSGKRDKGKEPVVQRSPVRMSIHGQRSAVPTGSSNKGVRTHSIDIRPSKKQRQAMNHRLRKVRQEDRLLGRSKEMPFSASPTKESSSSQDSWGSCSPTMPLPSNPRPQSGSSSDDDWRLHLDLLSKERSRLEKDAMEVGDISEIMGFDCHPPAGYNPYLFRDCLWKAGGALGILGAEGYAAAKALYDIKKTRASEQQSKCPEANDLTRVYVTRIRRTKLRNIKDAFVKLRVQMTSVHNMAYVSKSTLEVLLESDYRHAFIRLLEACGFKVDGQFDPTVAADTKASPEVQLMVRLGFLGRLRKTMESATTTAAREYFKMWLRKEDGRDLTELMRDYEGIEDIRDECVKEYGEELARQTMHSRPLRTDMEGEEEGEDPEMEIVEATSQEEERSMRDNVERHKRKVERKATTQRNGVTFHGSVMEEEEGNESMEDLSFSQQAYDPYSDAEPPVSTRILRPRGSSNLSPVVVVEERPSSSKYATIARPAEGPRRQ